METASRGQFCEFIRKLLVRVNDDKVKNIDKTKIQNAINSLNSEDVVIDNLIRFINNGCRLQIIGNHEINTDATPTMPFPEASVEFHKKKGMMTFDPSKIKFHLSPNQKGGSTIQGHKLRKELEKENVLNACVLDYLVANPHLILEDWKKDAQGNTRFIYFWGTIYRNTDDRLYVRSLFCAGGKWLAGYNWLDFDWNGDSPAAVSAS